MKRLIKRAAGELLRMVAFCCSILLAVISIARYGVAPTLLAVLGVVAVIAAILLLARQTALARRKIDRCLGLDRPGGLLALLVSVCIASAVAAGLLTKPWVIPVAFGVAFAALVVPLIQRDRADVPHGRIRPCPHCGYNRLNINTRSNCPECGRSPWM